MQNQRGARVQVEAGEVPSPQPKDTSKEKMPKVQGEQVAPPSKIYAAIGLYCLCSSSLLFLNKFSVGTMGLPPGAVVCIQLLFATVSCVLLRLCGGVSIGNCEPRKLKLFALYVVAFVGSIYSSVMALRHSNVETFIVFRASTPIVVSVLDAMFLGRSLPSRKSAMALFGTAAAAACYVTTDAQFRVEGFAGYSWCAIYFGLICLEMTFGKHLVSSLRAGVWESVFLTNTLALPLLLALASARGELVDIGPRLRALSAAHASIFFLSCLVATLIGYSGWCCRGLVSATAYTLIGVANKLGTVLLAVAFLEKHATPAGILSLLLCIAASSQYSQPPLRTTVETVVTNGAAAPDKDGDEEPLLHVPASSPQQENLQLRSSSAAAQSSDVEKPPQRSPVGTRNGDAARDHRGGNNNISNCSLS